MGFVGPLKPGNGAVSKAHRLEHIGVAGVGIGDAVAKDRCALSVGGFAACHHLGQDRQHTQHDGSAQGQGAEPGVQDIDEHQEQRNPGQIEQRDGPLTAKERTDGVDIAAAFERFGGGVAKRGMSTAT